MSMPALLTIHPGSLESIVVGMGQTASQAASAAFPAANRALFVPFTASVPILVTRLFSYTGATANGNIDVGIYTAENAGGRLLFSSGSTAQSASTNALQVFDISAASAALRTLYGEYYLAVAMDNGTGTLFRWNTGVTVQRDCGCFQMATAFPLPTTFTAAQVAASYVPFIGLKHGGTAL